MPVEFEAGGRARFIRRLLQNYPHNANNVVTVIDASFPPGPSGSDRAGATPKNRVGDTRLQPPANRPASARMFASIRASHPRPG
jgi:hypothetical protein